MTVTNECVRQRVIGFRAVSGNGGANTYLLGTACFYCDTHIDPMRRDGKPCVDAYWHAFHTVNNWLSEHQFTPGYTAHVEPVYAEVDPAAEADRDPADRLVDAINTYAQQRADSDDPNSWTVADSARRYVAVLRGIRATRTGEREVTVTAPDTADGRIWGYMAGQLIDGPCEDVDPEGTVFDLGTALINPVVERQKYVFTWGPGSHPNPCPFCVGCVQQAEPCI